MPTKNALIISVAPGPDAEEILENLSAVDICSSCSSSPSPDNGPEPSRNGPQAQP